MMAGTGARSSPCQASTRSRSEERGKARGVYLSLPEAKLRLKKTLHAIGWKTDSEDEGTLKNFYTDARWLLIVETNVLDTVGHGRFCARPCRR